MKVYQFELGPIGVNAYVIFPENSSNAILIDAPQDSCNVVLKFLEEQKRTLNAILLTHAHFDHSWEAFLLKEKTNAKIYAHSDTAMVVGLQNKESGYGFGEIKEFEVDKYVADGDNLDIDGVKIKCLYAPGHCAGSIMYYLPSEKKLFSGDVLFRESIGRYDLPTGSFGVLQKSIKSKVYTLTEDTEIFPGHGPETSVGYEMKFNPFIDDK